MPGTTLLSMVARLSEPWRSCSTSWPSRIVTCREGATRLFCVRAVTVMAASSVAWAAAGAEGEGTAAAADGAWRAAAGSFSSA